MAALGVTAASGQRKGSGEGGRHEEARQGRKKSSEASGHESHAGRTSMQAAELLQLGAVEEGRRAQERE